MQEQTPGWLRNGKVDEVAYCLEFLTRNDMICCGGRFYTWQGLVEDETWIRKKIYEDIKPHITSRISARVEHLLSALRLETYSQKIKHDEVTIHTANGMYCLGEGKFYPYQVFCRHRLPVNYNAQAPQPARWLSFLSELLEPEDIQTLQEFMGYCLLPVTYAQKMLMIIGNGGEGKSRIGVVMRALLGDNMSQGSIAKVETSPFARADLEHKLVLVDDDLKMEALSQTHYLKSIISAEIPMDLERKGVQSYQGKLYARFLAFGNGSLQALHDRSYGFFRRQIILTARPRDPDRHDDPFLGKELAGEAEGILLWCIEGLERLVCNDFQFTLSLRTNGNLYQSMLESNNMMLFMDSEGYFRFDPAGSISSRQLYNLYKDWCEDNTHTPFSARTFWNYLYQNAADYGLNYSNNIAIGNGKKARGFRGIRLLNRC